jgi:uncharacterized protein YyaL (SSP411 family)
LANALAAEASPYLRQHADNPVDWLPWGPLALDSARERDVPLFVSIGYSACHWCHVMEHESFSDPATAALMNERFVCVKVDREERPDIDGIYMEAVQLMTGHGGWPLNVFLTGEQKPFFGGTYWPPEPRHGMPSFGQVLSQVAEIWSTRRDHVSDIAARLAERLRQGALLSADDSLIDETLLDRAVARIGEGYDSRNGGFGGAPKFPPHCAIEFLLRRGESEMALGTLRAMARGGICDQIGGGFARYSVDATWTVPHFEKMLYDNALLARAYLHGWQRSGDELLLRTCRETLEFCLGELRAPDGSFYCSLDADSEGVEGRYYVWTLEELHTVLGERADAAIEYFGASAAGNFEGANVLVAIGREPPDRSEIRELLRVARDRRVRPSLDDKRIASWNALMIAALAEAGAVLEEPRYLEAAVAAAEFVWRELRDSDGRLLRSQGTAIPGFLEDHAFLLEALLTLYEATFDERFFTWASELAETMLDRFHDSERGGFFTSALDGELLTRRKELEDQPIPSGSASAALGLLRLAALSGERRYEDAALGAIRLSTEIAPRHPTVFAHTLSALDFYLADIKEIALVGPDLEPFKRVVHSEFRPHVVLAGSPDGAASTVPLLAGRSPGEGGEPAAFVCRRFACEAPVTTPSELSMMFGSVHAWLLCQGAMVL